MEKNPFMHESQPMIAREWKCSCPSNHKEGFLQHLFETGVKETTSTKGFKGFQIFERELGEYVEITLITYWDALESVKAFAGEDINVAKLYPQDQKFNILPDTDVKHYKVVEHRFKD